MTEETMGTDFQATCLVDGPADDYENWSVDLPDELHKHKAALYAHGRWILMRNESYILVRRYQTEANVAESREVTILMSGAWKT